MNRKWQKLFVCVIALGILPVVGWARAEETEESGQAWAPDRPWEVIDIALALDTSGSMNGLIEAAQLKLWEIVGDLTRLEPSPILRVALLTYGDSRNDWKQGWVRVETDLTQDLDLVSERLSSLTSDSGRGEYVARVLQAALERLSWTASRDALKLVFIAGNEPADQDPELDFREVSELARQEGIFVHAIFWGTAEHAHAETWKELAWFADGRFASVDHNTGTVIVETPFDQQLVELSTALTETFIPLGERGRERQAQLAEQDENARALGPAAAASRAQVRTSRLYSTGWDLVDELESENVGLDELDENELPEGLRRMSLAERALYVEEMRSNRYNLIEQISELGRKRRRHIADQVEAGLDLSGSFDAVILRAIRESAEEKGFYLPRD